MHSPLIDSRVLGATAGEVTALLRRGPAGSYPLLRGESPDEAEFDECH